MTTKALQTSSKTNTANSLLAVLLCDSGGDARHQIGQGHLSRCRAFAAHLQVLGWETLLLELRVSAVLPHFCLLRFRNSSGVEPAKSSGSTEYYCPLHYKELQNLCRLPGPKIRFNQAPRLFVLDSYHLPKEFYQHIENLFPASRMLAIDDGSGETRLRYPHKFFVLQAFRCFQNTCNSLDFGALPSNFESFPNGNRYLCGLKYQVLHPQFCRTQTNSVPADPVVPNLANSTNGSVLFIPGSAFTLSQVQELAQVLFAETVEKRHKNTAKKDDAPNLIVLLSPRQSAELTTKGHNEGVHYLHALNASQLRSLYLCAHTVFCAASQSLLELLALGTNARICALLSADNQKPLLRRLYKSGLTLLDLRPALQNGETAPAQLLKSKLQAIQCVLPLQENSQIQQLGDGQAVQRILLQMSLSR